MLFAALMMATLVLVWPRPALLIAVGLVNVRTPRFAARATRFHYLHVAAVLSAAPACLAGFWSRISARSDMPDFTVSIGVVDTTAGSTTEDLVRMADDCLYAAKEEGRDRVVIGPVAPQPEDEIESSQQR